MSVVLLTGFEAFGDTPVNPAEHVARFLDGAGIGAIVAHPADTDDPIVSRLQI